MRFIGLVSGGKDSCYAMQLTAAAGHQLVALGNLKPPLAGETDSYMYQTVGQDALSYYSEAMGVPLFQRTITGTPVNQEMEYGGAVGGDEVEVRCYFVLNFSHILYLLGPLRTAARDSDKWSRI